MDGRGGAVAIVQRFGGALNLNIDVHALVVEGAFARDGAGVRFCPLPSITTADVAGVLKTVVPRGEAPARAPGAGRCRTGHERARRVGG